MAGVLHEIAVRGLLADVVLLVVAMAFCRVQWNGRSAAGSLVALRILRNGLDGFVQRLCHRWSPLLVKANATSGRPFPEPSFVIPGRASWRGPGIHNHGRLSSREIIDDRAINIGLGLWIPGSALRAAPE
jgi:hypothetical protein